MNQPEPQAEKVWTNSKTSVGIHWVQGLSAVTLALVILGLIYYLEAEDLLRFRITRWALIPVFALLGWAFKHLTAGVSSSGSKAAIDQTGVAFAVDGADSTRVNWTDLDRLVTTVDGVICLIGNDDGVLFRFDQYSFQDPEALACEIAERSGKRYSRMASAMY